MSNVSLSNDCYVYKHQDGCSTRGFQSLYDETQKLWDILNQKHLIQDDSLQPLNIDFGQLSLVEKNQSLLSIARTTKLPTWYNANTAQAVQNVLERAIKCGFCVRIFYGDADTGRDWMEENDVQGYISRSTGILKIPLLVSKHGHGGLAILDHCIVRIMEVETRKELYRHPTYYLGNLKIVPSGLSDYPYSVYRNETLQANFDSYEKAAHFIAFMTGESFDFPSY